MTALDVVRPGDARYPGVRDVYTATGAPAAVVRPRSPEEVPAALAFACAQPGPLSVRSGGHGISSVATNVGGTVVDLGALDEVTRVSEDIVRLGPGARWGGVARTLLPWGLAVSSGDSGDVGVGGLATSGGVGLMGRAHGLTIDRVTAADLVTAAGRTLHLSAHDHPDLFWAVRGAGAEVGIVIAVTVRAARTPVVVVAEVAYRLRDPTAFLQRWGEAVENAPRRVSAFLYAGAGPTPFAQATVVFAGDDEQAAVQALEPFVQFPETVGNRTRKTPYATLPLTTGAPHTGQQAAVSRAGLVDHVGRDIAARLAALLAGPGVQMLQIRSVGGAINEVAPDATAYAHRHQNFLLAAMYPPDLPADPEWEPVLARTTGLYLNFESGLTPADVVRAFPPATLSRLRRIKRVWDPDRVFTQYVDVSPDDPERVE